jgi:hypothetical protein
MQKIDFTFSNKADYEHMSLISNIISIMLMIAFAFFFYICCTSTYTSAEMNDETDPVNNVVETGLGYISDKFVSTDPLLQIAGASAGGAVLGLPLGIYGAGVGGAVAGGVVAYAVSCVKMESNDLTGCYYKNGTVEYAETDQFLPVLCPLKYAICLHLPPIIQYTYTYSLPTSNGTDLMVTAEVRLHGPEYKSEGILNHPHFRNITRTTRTSGQTLSYRFKKQAEECLISISQNMIVEDWTTPFKLRLSESLVPRLQACLKEQKSIFSPKDHQDIVIVGVSSASSHQTTPSVEETDSEELKAYLAQFE